MIEFKTGNILAEDAEALVNTVNCVGVMGRGVALHFKKAFPDNFKAYASACKREEVRPGRMFTFATGQLTYPHYIINFPTKRHWRAKSRIEDIEAGLSDLVREIRERNIQSIAIPPLGSGLGKLDWTDVRARIEGVLGQCPHVKITVFEPSAKFEDVKPNRSSKPPPMTPGRAALVGLMRRYLDGFLDPFVTLLEVHKLMYFMQYAGEPLRLEFRAAHYGPYAENLRHVLRAMEGHMISGYVDDGDKPEKELNLLPDAAEEALAFLKGHPESHKRFEKVADLVEGFESSFGLELLATVHWLVDHDESIRNNQDIVNRMYNWNDAKQQFTPRQIGIAADTLARKGWMREVAA